MEEFLAETSGHRPDGCWHCRDVRQLGPDPPRSQGLRLRRHQATAIEAANSGDRYVLLANDVMLELLLTRPSEKLIARAARGLQFLVRDALRRPPQVIAYLEQAGTRIREGIR